MPAPFLKPRFGVAHSSALFSATLSPWHYYSDLLGLPADTAWVDVASPFEAKQLEVHVVTRDLDPLPAPRPLGRADRAN